MKSPRIPKKIAASRLKPLRFVRRKSSSLSSTVALPPGTVVYLGTPKTEAPQVDLIAYDEQQLVDQPDIQIPPFEPPIQEGVSWVNVDGIHDPNLIQQVGDWFELHPLIQEDIANTTQRPKSEEYGNCYYLVLKMITYKADSREIDTEQVSLVLKPGLVLSFQEKTEDVFDPIRQRIRMGQGRVRKTGADYLFYALIDLIVSNYFTVLEGLEDQIDDLESRMHNGALSSGILQEIQDLKGILIFLRKSVFPLREVINRLERNDDSKFVQEKTLIFFRDIQDQLYHVIELIETYRDVLSNLHDLHLSLNGHKMNEVMKLLTIIATIFIPLTFVAGIYGMNFETMPELKWNFGYLAVWILMGLMTIGQIYYFRRRKWL